VDELLRCGANPNAVQSNGVSVLHAAVAPGNERVIETLLLAEADVQASLPVCRWTPLHRAAAAGATECAATLLMWGAVIDQPKSDGQTPLDLARLNGRRDSEDLLLRHQPGGPSAGALSPLTPTVRVPTLRHLAAVKIRKCLGRRRRSHVDTLHLPEQLKRYINHGRPFEQRPLETPSNPSPSLESEQAEGCNAGNELTAYEDAAHRSGEQSLLCRPESADTAYGWQGWWRRLDDWWLSSAGGVAVVVVALSAWLHVRRRVP
jgi:hypothetical protein